MLTSFLLVGARGFEPPTPTSRTLYATGLRYAPILKFETAKIGYLWLSLQILIANIC